MKRYLAILVLVLTLFLGVTPLQAQTQADWEIQAKSYQASTSAATLTSLGEVRIYGFSILADAADAVAGLYDAASIGAAAVSNLVGEVGAAAASDSKIIWLQSPYLISSESDLVVIVQGGTLTVYYK